MVHGFPAAPIRRQSGQFPRGPSHGTSAALTSLTVNADISAIHPPGLVSSSLSTPSAPPRCLSCSPAGAPTPSSLRDSAPAVPSPWTSFPAQGHLLQTSAQENPWPTSGSASTPQRPPFPSAADLPISDRMHLLLPSATPTRLKLREAGPLSASVQMHPITPRSPSTAGVSTPC